MTFVTSSYLPLLAFFRSGDFRMDFISAPGPRCPPTPDSATLGGLRLRFSWTSFSPILSLFDLPNLSFVSSLPLLQYLRNCSAVTGKRHCTLSQGYCAVQKAKCFLFKQVISILLYREMPKSEEWLAKGFGKGCNVTHASIELTNQLQYKSGCSPQ